MGAVVRLLSTFSERILVWGMTLNLKTEFVYVKGRLFRSMVLWIENH